MLTDVRGEPTAVDAEWMTAVLEEGGMARGATVTGVRLVGLIGTGQMGRSARFALTWDDPSGRPATVVGKFPAEDATARSTGFDSGGYVKEWIFYRDFKHRVAVRTPDVWVNLYDADARVFVLIMEDLAGCEQGDQFRGLTVDEAALAVEQAVLFHAPLWGDRSVVPLAGDDADESAAKLSAFYGMAMEGTLARLGHALDEEAVSLVRRFAPHVGRWAAGTDTPPTLVHLDYRPDNFLFGVAPGAPPLAIVDWATITCALGTHDLAYMIGGSFEPEQRAAVERDLLADYRRRLAAAGVAYDADACWRDYRISSLWGVIMSVAATMLAQETERGNRMFITMLRRHARHALDLDALELVS